MKYTLYISPQAQRDIKIFKKKSSKIFQKIISVLNALSESPFNQRLRTHKVQTSKHGVVYSTRITGDLRIIWNYKDDEIIVVITIGGHSGKNSVYL